MNKRMVRNMAALMFLVALTCIGVGVFLIASRPFGYFFDIAFGVLYLMAGGFALHASYLAVKLLRRRKWRDQ